MAARSALLCKSRYSLPLPVPITGLNKIISALKRLKQYNMIFFKTILNYSKHFPYIGSD